MKLLGNTRGKINKDKNAENVLHLEITEVVLIDCNIVNNNYHQDSRVLIHLFLIFGQVLDILPGNFLFLKVFNLEFSIEV